MGYPPIAWERMIPQPLSTNQQNFVERPIPGSTFLEGISGTGKTTAAVARVYHLLDAGIRADSIFILVPQRSLAEPYRRLVSRSNRSAGGEITIVTLGGFARRMVELFWPLIAENAGFTNPKKLPLFLTLETAQYYMTQTIGPLIERERFFESLSIPRNRIFSQIIDNMNKSAVVGFDISEIGGRLREAWVGEAEQGIIYEQAQECAIRFREACLERNLLDFSLQIQVFREQLWPHPIFQSHIRDRYHHLIADNLEEDVPVCHDLLQVWLPSFESALLIYDQVGGYRRFLGADPQSAYRFKALSDEQVAFHESFVTSQHMKTFAGCLKGQLMDDHVEHNPGSFGDVHIEYQRYHPQMLSWVADEVASLIHERGVQPDQIVAIAPFMGDALRFSLIENLSQKGIPTRSHRPSRALRDEPAAQCLLTLAALAHPQWGIVPSAFEVAGALMNVIGEIDLIRANLLTKVLYRSSDGTSALLPFDQVRGEMQRRITFTFGQQYEELRKWLQSYEAGPELALDHFLRRIFGELLSQSGYHFWGDYDAGAVAEKLIESVQKFRWVLEHESFSGNGSTGHLYLAMVRDGVLASHYLQDWEKRPQDAVLLAPAYTFLMTNQAVDYQFWLEIGSPGWWERLYQPLTHPYVLSRNWSRGSLWTDDEEYTARRETLHTLTQGLVNRCRKGIYLGLSDLGEDGLNQHGPLLRALQAVFLTQFGSGGIADV
jgi:hypothetical protein